MVDLGNNQLSDQASGKLVRYVGRVTEHVAEPGEKVDGMIIFLEADEAISYTRKTVPKMMLRYYRV